MLISMINIGINLIVSPTAEEQKGTFEITPIVPVERCVSPVQCSFAWRCGVCWSSYQVSTKGTMGEGETEFSWHSASSPGSWKETMDTDMENTTTITTTLNT